MSDIIRKTNLADRGNYGISRSSGVIKYIVIHYTANDGDTDESNGRYFHNNVVKTSAHYFVDSDSVTQSVPDNFAAWAVGGSKYASCAQTGGGKLYGKCTNTNSLSIELCDDKKDGKVFASDKTIANAQALTKELMKKYNIPLENVIRHFDVTGKPCPAYFVDEAKWAAFKAGLEEKKMDNTPASYAKDAVNWAVKKGIMAGDTKGDLMLNKPITRQQFVVMLYRFAKMIGKA